jgi:hypothetical protein
MISADRLAAFVASDEMLNELSAKRARVIHDPPAFSFVRRRV